MIQKRLKYSIAVIVSLLALTTAAHADLLTGKWIALDYLYGSNTSAPVLLSNSYQVYVTPPGHIADMLAGDLIDASVDFYNYQIVITISNGGFTDPGFNGPHIYDYANSIAPFTSVSINPATTFTAFTSSMISFDANDIWINFSGHPGDGIVSLDLNASSSVPEPCTLLLLSGGLVGLVAFKKSFRKA